MVSIHTSIYIHNSSSHIKILTIAHWLTIARSSNILSLVSLDREIGTLASTKRRDHKAAIGTGTEAHQITTLGLWWSGKNLSCSARSCVAMEVGLRQQFVCLVMRKRSATNKSQTSTPEQSRTSVCQWCSEPGSILVSGIQEEGCFLVVPMDQTIQWPMQCARHRKHTSICIRIPSTRLWLCTVHTSPHRFSVTIN
jgi:hypothetical protein